MTDAIFVPNSGKHKFGGDRYAVHENGKADIVSIRRDAGIVLPCRGDRLVCALALDGALVHGLLENVNDLLDVGAVLNRTTSSGAPVTGERPPLTCRNEISSSPGNRGLSSEMSETGNRTGASAPMAVIPL